METKNCQNCKQDFIIESDDFSFYEKVKVPPPTFCPECRMIQILYWRNQRVLYKRKCSLTGDTIVSIYDENVKFPVYKNDAWKSDAWDPYSYEKEYDFSKSFFSQFIDLFNAVPRIAITHNGVVVNSDYANSIFDSKNIYLASSVLNSEDVQYSSTIDYCKRILDGDNLTKCEECYETLNSQQCFNCTYIVDSKSCMDSDYLFDCVNCQSCLLCTNQRNKSYMIMNKQHSKEEYLKLKNDININSYSTRLNLFSQFIKLKNDSIHKYNRNRACVNVVGDTTDSSKNCTNVFMAYESENVKNGIRVVKSKDSQDIFGIGPNASFIYQGLTCSLGTVNTQFSVNIISSHNVLYSNYCSNSHDLFGCVGLKNASYCILNKQYSKQDYHDLVKKITKHMQDFPYLDKRGNKFQYGDFFPDELSPFAYNETVAFEYRPTTQFEAVSKGYTWKEREKSKYNPTVGSNQLDDSIISEDITSAIISCEINSPLCSNSFRINEMELLFYKKHNLPLPRMCPMCRLHKRQEIQYPFKLFQRICMCEKENHNNHAGKCEVEFETSYAPERPEIVYCEKCYQQEVY